MAEKFNTKTFIEKAKAIHGDYYEYPDPYIAMLTSIRIICPIHGEFTMMPSSHIHARQRCGDCALAIRRRENFEIQKGLIEKAHGDKYEVLDNPEYQTIHSKQDMFCMLHGHYVSTLSSVRDTPYGGCGNCKILKEGEVFITKAKALHGDKYVYNVEDYVCSRTMMEILCTKHNIPFKQRPSAHIQGQGCPTCGEEDRKISMTKTNEAFIKEAMEVHNNLYDYTNTEYINAVENVKVFCKEQGHGEFSVIANNHVNGQGCQKCSREGMFLGKDQFISDSIVEYGNGALDYSLVQYVNNTTKVKLKCNQHDEWFNVTPLMHRDKNKNSGCPTCGKLGMNRWSIASILKIPNIHKKYGYFYLGYVDSLDDNVYKIGITSSLSSREYTYKKDLPLDSVFTFLNYRRMSYLDCARIESSLKMFFKPLQVKSNIKFGGYTEIFNLDSTLYEMVNDIIDGSNDDVILPNISDIFSNNIDISFIEDLYKERYSYE